LEQYLISNTSTVTGRSFTGTLGLYLYVPISTVDAGSDANVDVVVWTSAGPDCQFSQPCVSNPATGTIFDFEAPEVQCDIQGEFMHEFSSFVDNCAYLTDVHYVASEESGLVTDVLKRYCDLYQPGETATTNENLVYRPATYNGTLTPVYRGTVQRALLDMFMFRRGGVSQKKMLVPTAATPTNTGQFVAQFLTGSLPSGMYSAQGNAMVVHARQDQMFEYSLPYTWIYPYYAQYDTPTAIQRFSPGNTVPYDLRLTLAYASFGCSVPPGTTVQNYTAVRDDFSVGYLIPPVFYSGSSLREKKPMPVLNLKDLAPKRFIALKPKPQKLGFFQLVGK